MRQPLENRLLDKFTVGDGCWEWSRFRGTSGYGMIRDHGVNIPAHRAIYEMFVGPIPQGHQLHHTCENRGCVRPSHLMPVLPREHIVNLTPRALAYINKRLEVCSHGHPFDETNTIVGKDGHRVCRACRKEVDRIRYANPTIREKQLQQKRQASKDPEVRARRAARDRAKYDDPTFRGRKAAYDRLRRMKASSIEREEAAQ